MRLLQAGRHVPVNVPHIVMVLVFAQVGQVHARATQQRAVVTLQQAVQATQYCPLQAAQELFCAFCLFRRRVAHGLHVQGAWRVAGFLP